MLLRAVEGGGKGTHSLGRMGAVGGGSWEGGKGIHSLGRMGAESGREAGA